VPAGSRELLLLTTPGRLCSSATCDSSNMC
jgi:hypothetical protein